MAKLSLWSVLAGVWRPLPLGAADDTCRCEEIKSHSLLVEHHPQIFTSETQPLDWERYAITVRRGCTSGLCLGNEAKARPD